MTKRRQMTQQEDGSWVESTFDVDWSEVRGMRKGLLQQTDLWYLKDRWDNLSSAAKGKLNTLRKTLRDLPQTYDNPNDAFDNFPEPEEWMIEG